MLTMWMLFAALTLLALVFVCWPFLRRTSDVNNPGVNAQRIAVFEQRQQELAQELADERISNTHYNEAVIELKRRLLNDLSPEKTLESRGNNRILALTGALFVLVLSGVFYAFTGSQAQLSSWEQAMSELPELGERAVLGKGEPLSANERQALVLGLRTRLATEGDDPVAWLMLGRVAMTLNDFEMAMQAFEKVITLDNDNVSARVSYAQALLIEGDQSKLSQAAALLSRVLQMQPQNMDAISMLALIAYEREDWLEAKSAFELLLTSLNENDPRYAMVSQRIAQINEQLSGEQAPEHTGEGVTVSVSLAPELTSSVPENGILFVFAKAASGPPMPLAVKRLEQFNLPFEVQLTQADAMMANLSLAQYEQVQVVARISIDGDVATAAGELQGQTGTFNHTQQSKVDVVIDTVME